MAALGSATFSSSASLAGVLYGNTQNADGGPVAKNYLLPDQSTGGSNVNIGMQGGMNYCVTTGEPFLAKGPDGALHWYRFQHSSTPANPVMTYVGP